eukprot:jgi/Chlat1/3243/Chrsp22S03429
MPDCVACRMTVTKEHTQVVGILHGGISLLLAEHVASIAGGINNASGQRPPVGLEVSGNHIASVRPGDVIVATTRPLHRGRNTQVWDVRIEVENTTKLVCAARVTLATFPSAKL